MSQTVDPRISGDRKFRANRSKLAETQISGKDETSEPAVVADETMMRTKASPRQRRRTPCRRMSLTRPNRNMENCRETTLAAADLFRIVDGNEKGPQNRELFSPPIRRSMLLREQPRRHSEPLMQRFMFQSTRPSRARKPRHSLPEREATAIVETVRRETTAFVKTTSIEKC